MKRLSENEMSDLNATELNRIHAVLRRRFGDFDQGNILNISFGKKVVNGQQQRCIRFWVRRKRMPRKKSDRLPAVFPVRFRRWPDNRWVEARFPTDVVEVADVQPTGEYVAVRDEDQGDLLACSTGLVLEISREYGGEVYDLAGLLTVAHPFEGIARHRVPVLCQGRTIDGITGENVPGTVRYRTLHQKFDAAFIETGHHDLPPGNYLVDSGVDKQVVPEEEIYQMSEPDADGNGETCQLLRPGGDAYSFPLSDYLPETMTPLPFFGHMRGVLMGPGTLDDFQMYSSGSPWIATNRPVAMQFAWQRTDSGEEFGLGQALFAILEEWLNLTPETYRVLNTF